MCIFLFTNSSLRQAMAAHSSTLAWKIPWAEEPGRLRSMGSLRVGTTEWLHFHFSLLCTGEGNGNPLQCSCLENPRDRGAWWAAISGVSQSWTQMKGLSSSSKSSSSRQENEWGGYRFVIGQSCWWEGEGNIPFKKWYFKNYLTTIVCWAYTMYQTLRYWHKQIKTVKSICT